jgi:hypothetical protein
MLHMTFNLVAAMLWVWNKSTISKERFYQVVSENRIKI